MAIIAIESVNLQRHIIRKCEISKTYGIWWLAAIGHHPDAPVLLLDLHPDFKKRYHCSWFTFNQEFQSCNGHVLHDSFLIISTGLQCVQRFQLIARGTAQWPAEEAENLGETWSHRLTFDLEANGKNNMEHTVINFLGTETNFENLMNRITFQHDCETLNLWANQWLVPCWQVTFSPDTGAVIRERKAGTSWPLPGIAQQIVVDAYDFLEHLAKMQQISLNCCHQKSTKWDVCLPRNVISKSSI